MKEGLRVGGTHSLVGVVDLAQVGQLRNSTLQMSRNRILQTEQLTSDKGLEGPGRRPH